MGLNPSTVHRYAVTLAALGFLRQDKSRRYHLSPRAGGLGASVLNNILLRTAADETLRRLRDRTGFTAGLAVLDGYRATYVRRYHAHGRGQYEADGELRSGAHVTLHDTAIGKALLACVANAEATSVLEEIISHGTLSNGVFDARELNAEIAEAAITGTAASNERGQARAVAAFVPRQIDGLSLAVDVTAPASRISLKSLEEWVVSPLTQVIGHVTGAISDVLDHFMPVQ